MDISWDEAFNILDLMVSTRYPGSDGMDFLAAYSEGLADDMFPDSADLQILAGELDENE